MAGLAFRAALGTDLSRLVQEVAFTTGTTGAVSGVEVKAGGTGRAGRLAAVARQTVRAALLASSSLPQQGSCAGWHANA